MEKKITYNIQIKARDLWLFNLFYTNRGVYLIFNGAFTISALYLLVTNWTTSGNTYRAAIFFFVLLFPVFQPLMLYRKARRQAGRPAMMEPITLTFDERGLGVKQSEQEILFTWEDIGRIDRMPGLIIIYMDRVHAYLIPKAVYNENLADFFALLHRYLPEKKRKRI